MQKISSTSFQRLQKEKEHKKAGKIFHCISFLTRAGVAGCFQTVHTAADRSLTSIMSQTKGKHGFRLTLFIVCSNGDIAK